MEGFFTNKEVRTLQRADGKTYSCVSCGLYKDCKSPRMKPYGGFKKRIMNIGEAPGDVEDATGKSFQGPAGAALRRAYRKLGIDLFEDCININAINCMPPKGEDPSNFSIDCCQRIVFAHIQHYKPNVIVLLGSSPLYSLLGNRWQKALGGLAQWRGWTIPDLDFKAWICPTFHPSYVMRMDAEDVTKIWMQDLERAVALSDTPLPKYIAPDVEVIDDLRELRSIKANTDVAIDYETTGIKPHATGHRIICAAVADTADHAYAFMLPATRAERQPFIDLLTNPNIGKIAQNMKYEHAWSLVRLKTEVQNWVWDTMLASHILDNRAGITGLKFQVYVNFGVVDYASTTAPFLRATENDNANAINNIHKLLEQRGGATTLLKYCGEDAVYEYRLARLQQARILLPF